MWWKFYKNIFLNFFYYSQKKIEYCDWIFIFFKNGILKKIHIQKNNVRRPLSTLGKVLQVLYIHQIFYHLDKFLMYI
jgi:hypothetical protein